MGWTPSLGDRVISKNFGPAIVRKVDLRTAFIYLENQGIEIQVALDSFELKPATENKPTINNISSTESADLTSIIKKRKTDIQKKRIAVEALRFGLVPESEIESLTLGYHELQSWVISRLPDTNGGNPQVSEIYGPFGEGKSHMMTVIRHVADQQGYLVARIEVNGSSITLSNPETLLYHLWTSLKANGFVSNSPILDLCFKAQKSGRPAPIIAPVGIDRVRDNYNTARLISRPELEDKYGYALNAIMCSSDEFTASQVSSMIYRDPTVNPFEVRVRRMIGQKVVDRPYDFMEAWVGYAILAKLAGFKGLVVTIDEFEVERFLGQRQGRVDELLHVFVDYLGGNLHHPMAPLSVFFAAVGEEGHRGDAIVDYLIDEAGGEYYSLPTWSRDNLIELSKRIFDLYSKAFNLDQGYLCSTADDVADNLERRNTGDSGLIRHFIKSYVSALDSRYGPTNDKS